MMNKALSVDQRKGSGKAKAKKKAAEKSIKVVYISNPRKVNVEASEFRATVQELTGQDAEISEEDPIMFGESRDVGGGGGGRRQSVPDKKKKKKKEREEGEGGHDNQTSDSTMTEEELDGVLAPELLENFTGLLQSVLWYESPPVNLLNEWPSRA